MAKRCGYCHGPWSISSGPDRVVGPVSRSFEGIFAPLPDDFEFEYCVPCKTRNMTPELQARFYAVEDEYRKSKGWKVQGVESGESSV